MKICGKMYFDGIQNIWCQEIPEKRQATDGKWRSHCPQKYQRRYFFTHRVEEVGGFFLSL